MNRIFGIYVKHVDCRNCGSDNRSTDEAYASPNDGWSITGKAWRGTGRLGKIEREDVDDCVGYLVVHSLV